MSVGMMVLFAFVAVITLGMTSFEIYGWLKEKWMEEGKKEWQSAMSSVVSFFREDEITRQLLQDFIFAEHSNRLDIAQSMLTIRNKWLKAKRETSES